MFNLSKIAGVLFLWMFQANGIAQTYQGTGGPVNDDGTDIGFTLQIADLTAPTLTPEYGLKEVCLTVTHSWMADLDIRLTAPDGTTIMLTATLGGDQDGYMNTCFRDDAATHILDGTPPYTGLFQPFSNLGTINNNHIANGMWTLRILDTYAYADAGEVLAWSLTFGSNAPAPPDFQSTYLPIVILTTDDQHIIPDDPKIHGRISIIHNDQGLPNHLSDPVLLDIDMGIEVRGASSQSFPKKSYGFETRDSNDDDLEISLLGLPKEDDWILYAPYTDKSFLRDALTYKLGRDMMHYTSRTVFCEVFLNGDYQGVYCLEEKIKRDKNRVNITKITEQDTTGDKLTGGYIIKVDRDDGPGSYFVSEHEGTFPNEEIRVVYEDPEGPDLHPLQRAYIENFVDDFEDALYGNQFMDPNFGYRRYIDVPSFIDFFLVSELGHNVDAYRLSTFLYKDRNSIDSLLHAGPLWDFNLAFGNVNYCNCEFTFGWAYINSGACGNTPLWWARLLEDPAFANSIRCRYDALRDNILNTDILLSYIDSMALVFAPVLGRNYERWPILGRYVWPNHFIGTTYQDEIYYLRNWVRARLDWMDENLPGECLPSGTRDEYARELAVYPNPAQDYIEIKSDVRGVLRVVDLQGVERIVMKFDPGSPRVSLKGLGAGLYVMSLETADSRVYRGKVVIGR